MPSGIYKITSPSGAIYVGSAVDLGSRWRVHRHLLRKGTHHNPGLQRAAAKYGIESLEFWVLLVCPVENLIFFEQRVINAFAPRYNACRTAGSQLGRRHSAASNEKNAAAHRGKGKSAKERAAISARMKGNTIMVGRSLSALTRAKLSAIGTGRVSRIFSDDDCSRMAQEYRDGTGLLDLVSEFRADHRTIRRTLVASGVAIRPRGRTIAQGA